MATRGLRALHNARARKQGKANAGEADSIFARAIALQQAGQTGQAKILYRQILQVRPDHFDALHFLAVAEYQGGQSAEADRLFAKALAINPRSAEAHSNHSLALYELGRFAEAAASCERAIALKPDYAEAFSNLGNALRAFGRYEDALASADKAISLRPNFTQAYDVRGSTLLKLRQYDGAVASYDRAIAISPRFIAAYINRGIAYSGMLNYTAALASFDQALAINPNAADARLGRANALRQSGRIAEAIAEGERVLAADPNSFEALAMLGQCHEGLANMELAMSYYDKALAIKPDFVVVIENKIFALDFLDGVDFARQQQACAYWWQHVGAKIADREPLPLRNGRDLDRRLVVGYVSSDFRRHSAAFAIRPVLRHHDRSQVEVICYSCSLIEDEVTANLKTIADRWHNAAQWSDRRLIEQIQADRVDILVDLAGHSAGNRLEVFACKPAPIQISAWGLGTGTGLPTMDYLFSDPVAIPAEARPLFAETVFDLPCQLTMEPPPDLPLPTDPPILTRGHVTYGAFNRISKISDAALDVWSAILRADPAARLVLKHYMLDDDSVRRSLTEKFSSRSVSSDRIALLGRTTREDHLAAHAGVDICLDPFPHNGGISTFEALYVGVPVVALLGQSGSSRASGSILTAIGLTDWVATSPEHYAAIAAQFAARPAELAALRRDLPDMVAKSETGDNAAYARAVDAAYRTMWRTYCRQDN